MSDTPISDSTPHNVADLGMLCRRLERQLNASTSEIERLTSKVSQLYEGAEEQKQRIKRLEEAGNNLLWNFCPEYTSDFTESQSDALKQWNKAKEAKP
jgi:predicted RNase H-like nuclease (RuvC/YqgF family)